MIRQITTAHPMDLEKIKALVYRFNNKHFGIPVNKDRLYRWYHRHLTHGVIFAGENSLITGLFIDDPVRDWTVLAETAWYAEDRDGLRLLRKFIDYGRMHHVDEVRMTTLNTTPEGVLRLLQRMGFEEIERSHRLIL